MNQQTDRAVLVVSFGTSYESSRKATIEKDRAGHHGCF